MQKLRKLKSLHGILIFTSMPRIIFYYLSKEIFYVMLSVTMIIVFIFLCNQFVRYLGYVSSGKYAFGTLFHLIMLQAPILFGYVLPLGLYLGVLLGLGRLYADSEMTVLMACGLSRKQLLRMVFLLSAIVMIIVAFLVFWFNPKMALQRDKMLDAAEASTVFQTILPGHFQATRNGDRVLYIEKMSRDRTTMKNIFVAQETAAKDPNDQNRFWSVLSAATGYQWRDPETGEDYMVSNHGYRFSGIPGNKDYEIVQFDQYGVQIEAPESKNKNEGEEAISTLQLIPLMWGAKNYMAEFQWRLAMPISVLLLGLLAVPLSYVKPRHGRFAQLIPAVLIYFVYTNMIFVSRSWIENGIIPGWLGIWWVHLSMLIVVLFFMARYTGWHFINTRRRLCS